MIEMPIALRPALDILAIERILVIRMHAVGDVALTFPACTAIRRKCPNARIDFLTSRMIAPLAETLDVFDHVYAFPASPTPPERLLNAVTMGRSLTPTSYQLVLDLQSNWVTRLIRWQLRPGSWAEFDRTSPIPAADRVMNTSRSAGFHSLEPDYQFPLKTQALISAERLLNEHCRDPKKRLLVLNPAGLWKTRQWPDENYVELGRKMTQTGDWQILFLGTERVRPRVNRIAEEIGKGTINLVEKTGLDVALAVLQRVSMLVSEDSGLMHMAWVSGVPTVALLGSTRSDWARPVGLHTRCLDSSDLPCGSCMKEQCIFGDVHCLSRFTPGHVIEAVNDLDVHTKNRVVH